VKENEEVLVKVAKGAVQSKKVGMFWGEKNTNFSEGEGREQGGGEPGRGPQRKRKKSGHTK